MPSSDTPDILGELDDFADCEDVRTDVAKILREAIDDAYDKYENGRVRNAENERVRIQYLSALASLANAHRRIVNDIEEEEQEQRIQRLERLAEEALTN